jgi:methionyl aminopeptidase
MAIERLNEREREAMRAAGRAAAMTLAQVRRALRPGVTTADIDQLVRKDTAQRGGRPSQLGYQGFPCAVCTSINEVVCHGIPSRSDKLESGDIVNVDVTTELEGFHGDTSATFLIGDVSNEARRLVQTAERCLWAGIEAVQPGGRLGDIAAAIEAVAHGAGYSVVDSFGGHGIGRLMHMDPHVSHVGKRGTGPRLRPGMAFTIEPMINLGGPEVRVMRDGWTVVTQDGHWSAQFEHTVLVTEQGYEITTLAPASERGAK